MEHGLGPHEKVGGRPIQHSRVGLGGDLNHRSTSQCLKFLAYPLHASPEVAHASTATGIAHHGSMGVVHRTPEFAQVDRPGCPVINKCCVVDLTAGQYPTPVTRQQPRSPLSVEDAHHRVALLTPQ